jgi:DNA-binding CsgD family transcriptional regulator
MARRLGSETQADVGGALADATREFCQTVGLSGREREILALAAYGLVDKEISSRLGLAYTTTKSYWTRICFKLGVKNRQLAIGRLIADLAQRTRHGLGGLTECARSLPTQRVG